MFSRSSKQFKYALKAGVLSRTPGLYWGMRRLTKGVLEQEILLLPKLCHREKHSLDVGANWGAYAYYASKVSKSVHCFEPQARLVDVLERGVGSRSNVVIHGVAVSNRDGFAEIRVPRNDIGYSTIEQSNALEGKADLSLGVDCSRVALQRLDALNIGTVGFIKIDVEGHELEVLEGAAELLRRDQPKLVIEIEERHRAGALRAAWDLLCAIGYRAYSLENATLVGLDPMANCGHRNWVFVHDSQTRDL
jgi:FkbM family methyltransferase